MVEERTCHNEHADDGQRSGHVVLLCGVEEGVDGVVRVDHEDGHSAHHAEETFEGGGVLVEGDVDVVGLHAAGFLWQGEHGFEPEGGGLEGERMDTEQDAVFRAEDDVRLGRGEQRVEARLVVAHVGFRLHVVLELCTGHPMAC